MLDNLRGVSTELAFVNWHLLAAVPFILGQDLFLHFATSFPLRYSTSSPILILYSAALGMTDEIFVMSLDWAAIVSASLRVFFVAFGRAIWFDNFWRLVGSRGIVQNTNRVGKSPFGPAVSLMTLTAKLKACQGEAVGLPVSTFLQTIFKNAIYCSPSPSTLWLSTPEKWNLVSDACKRFCHSSLWNWRSWSAEVHPGYSTYRKLETDRIAFQTLEMDSPVRNVVVRQFRPT